MISEKMLYNPSQPHPCLLPSSWGRGLGWGCWLCCIFLFLSCGVPSGQVRVRGKYENLKQADFFILSTDGGLSSVDTLHVLNGEFEYTCDIPGDATYRIVYPNNSQLVLWAHGGDDVVIKGDVQDLWHVSVTGNEENELYTEFRQQNAATDTVALRNAAANFIRNHPDSQVSQYLLTQYFVLPDVPSDSTETLYKVIADALPQDPKVAVLGGYVQQRFALGVGKKMPDFDIETTDSVHHTLAEYRGKMFVLYFWAGWQGSSGYLHHELTKLRDELANPEEGQKVRQLELLGYSLDMDTIMLHSNMPDKSLKVPTCCDLQGFNSNLINQFGIRELPFLILVGEDGKIKLLTQEARNVRKYFE